MTPIVPASNEQPELAGGREDEPGRGHQQRADDQHAPAADAIGARREEQRDDGVADERQRQQQAGLRLAQPEADQIEHQHDRQRAVREQPDEARGEQQPAVPGEPLECRGGNQSRQYQLSAISNQRSVLSDQFSAISNQRSVLSVSSQQSVLSISNQQSVLSNQFSALSSQFSAISSHTKFPVSSSQFPVASPGPYASLFTPT